MTISQVGSATAGAYNTTSIANKPTGEASGDYIVAHIYSDGNNVDPTLTGFTKRVQVNNAGGPFTEYIYTRVADGSEGASFSAVGNGGNSVVLHISAWRDSGGAYSLDPFDQSSTATATGNASAPSITPSVNNCAVLFAEVNFGGAAVTPPSGYTELADADGLEEAFLIQTSAAATGAQAATGGSGAASALLFSFKPSTAGAAVVGVTPELVRSLGYRPKLAPKSLAKPAALPLAALATQPPSGAISAQAGLGIGVTAATVTVQTAYSITCQAGLGVGVTAAAVTVQTAYSVTASPALGIGVLTSANVATAYAVAAAAGLGIGVLKNLDVATAYSMGVQAGLGIGVLSNATLSGGSAISAQAGLGIGVAPNATLATAYTILCNAGIGIGVTQGVTVQTAYRLGLQAGLGIGVAGNISGMSATPFSVTPGLSGGRIGIDAHTGASRAPSARTGASRAPTTDAGSVRSPSGYTGVSRGPNAYTGVKR